MNHQTDLNQVIFNIMQAYPEDQWLSRCQKAMPDMDDISIMAIIEILSGGDVAEIQ